MRKNRREIKELRKNVDISYSELKGKMNIVEYEADLLEIRKKFGQLDRNISLKADIKDVCVLADSKPSTPMLIHIYRRCQQSTQGYQNCARLKNFRGRFIRNRERSNHHRVVFV